MIYIVSKQSLSLTTDNFFFQGIWCIGSILGTGAGVTAFIFLIVNTVRNYVDDDPETTGIAWISD